MISVASPIVKSIMAANAPILLGAFALSVPGCSVGFVISVQGTRLQCSLITMEEFRVTLFFYKIYFSTSIILQNTRNFTLFKIQEALFWVRASRDSYK